MAERQNVPNRILVGAPWWLELVLGVVLAAVGVFVLTRPFASIAVLLLLLGVGLLVAAVVESWSWFASGAQRRWWQLWVPAGLLVAGILVLAVRGATTRFIVVTVGVVLIALGLRELVRALRGGEDRIASALFGAAAVVFGVVGLAWQDVSVYAIAILFSVWLIVSGLKAVVRAVRRRKGPVVASARRVAGWVRVLLSVVAVVAAVVVGVAAVRLSVSPVPDAFYSAPAEVPGEPGQLLKAEPYDRAVPDGAAATAWRILYTTTRDDGVPAISSALVVVPDSVDEPPVIAWTHGTTGIAPGCAPSLQPHPWAVGGMPDTAEALQHGWAIVATDYIGLGADAPHQYLVGQPAARAELDALRAARQMDDVALGDETVIWGHSQGGGAALWTAGIAPDYAPELEIVGVAAMAPAANIPALIAGFAEDPLASVLGGLLLVGYNATYDDVRLDDYVIPEARIMVEEMGKRCGQDPSFVVSGLEAMLAGSPVWSRDPASGPLLERAKENIPTLPIAASLLIAQGLADPLVNPTAQQEYVDMLCTAGQQVDYRTYEGKDHMGVVTGDSPLLGELLEWTQDAFDGKAPKNTC